MNRQFPTLAFHFFSIPSEPYRMAVRIMGVRGSLGYDHFPFAKKGEVGSQYLWEEVDIEGFPSEHFLAKCALIA